MAYTRLLLGAHSISQVFFGLLMGLWASILFHNYFKEVVINEIKSLSRVYRITNKIGTATTIFIAYFLLQILLIKFLSKDFKPDPVWIDNII